jgi:DNA-binding transcriptional LysR family regulator
LALLPLDMVKGDIAQGRLAQVLSDWTPPTVGHHLYYPRRRQPSRVFTVFVEALRFRPNPHH